MEDYLYKVKMLINSGIRENIELAFTLIKVNQLPFNFCSYETIYRWLVQKQKVPQDIEKLTDKIINITEIEELKFANFNLIDIPEEIKILTNLKILDIHKHRLEILPLGLGELHKLENLNISQNKYLTQLPENIGNLKKLKVLDAYGCELENLPNSFAKLENLEYLLLFSNYFKKLPESIFQLSKLKVLKMGINLLGELPENIGSLKKLEILSVQNNKLTSIPDSIGQLTLLKELDLENNSLTTLPKTLYACKNLTHLRVKGNNINPKELIALSKFNKKIKIISNFS